MLGLNAIALFMGLVATPAAALSLGSAALSPPGCSSAAATHALRAPTPTMFLEPIKGGWARISRSVRLTPLTPPPHPHPQHPLTTPPLPNTPQLPPTPPNSP